MAFKFLFRKEWDYIRTHLTSVLTYLTSSLQTSLQNQTKREGYEKVTSLLDRIIDEL